MILTFSKHFVTVGRTDEELSTLFEFISSQKPLFPYKEPQGRFASLFPSTACWLDREKVSDECHNLLKDVVKKMSKGDERNRLERRLLDAAPPTPQNSVAAQAATRQIGRAHV